MTKLATQGLADTNVQEEWRPTSEFTYKSGARPLDGYTIKRGLGSGGFGEVYYAISDGGKEVALKLIRRYLEVELRGVSHCLNLKNPHLLQIYDVRQNDRDESWIVMEYISGPSLAEVLDRREQPLSLDETLHWMSSIANGIDYLHENGIVHRDLKPGNIFDENGLVKIGDYGLSKFISHSRRSGQTQSVGTVHYMAPEVSTGNYGKNVDIYSAGVIAFEMLTGSVPFDGETTGEVLMKHLTAEPALDRLETKYRPVFAQVLAKRPEDRFDSLRQFHDAIRAAGHGEPIALATPDVVQAKPEPAKVAVQPAPAPKGDLKMSLPPVPGTFAAKRRGASELLWTMFQSGVLSVVLPILVMLFNQNNTDLSLLKMYVSLTVLCGVGSWGIQAMARLWEARRVDASVRRLNMLLFGLGFGVLALGLNLWLQHLIPLHVLEGYLSATNPDEVVKSLAPTLFVYLGMFGLAFMIPDWAASACRTRPGRFSVTRVLWPGAVGFLLGNIFDHGPDPAWTAGILALTAIVVQWVSPYEPPRRRAYAAAY